MNYTITNIVRTFFMDDRGVAVDGYRVFFKMDDGMVDKVEITKARYNRANVHSAIVETIEEHQQVLEG